MFLFFLCPFLTLGQENSDSLKYYYYSIVEPTEKSDIPSAVNFFENYKRIRLESKDTLQAVYSSRLISQAAHYVGDVNESELEAVDGLKLIGEKKSEAYDEHRMGLYTQLGMVYRKLKDYDQALTNYDKALGFKLHPKERINLLNNKANAFKAKGDYINAQAILQNALEISIRKKLTMSHALILDNLGEVQQRLNNPESLNTLHKALKLRLSSENLKYRFTSYLSLADYYKTSNPDSSNYYARKAQVTAEKLKNKAYKLEALSTLLKNSSDPNIREFIVLSDSISTAIQNEDNKYAQRKWNVLKAEQQTELAKIEKQEERNKRILYQWIGVLIVVIGILLFLVFRLKHKREQTKQVYTTETRISKKVHDEVANDLYKLMAKIQTSHDTDEVLLDDLEAVYQKTRDISKESSLIPVDKNFGNVIKGLLMDYQSDNLNVITKNLGNITWDDISEVKKITLYRVLQELMTNMRKHSKATIVVITAKQSGKKLDVTYTDNGVGSELKKHNGLLNTENRIRSVNGTIIFDTTINKGFTAKIRL